MMEGLDLSDKKVLTLVLKKQWFDLMITGEKNKEFRNPSPWMKSRLIDKEGNPRFYHYAKFICGYQKDAPYFICHYEGYGLGYDNIYTFKSAPNLKLKVNPEDYVLFLGKVIYKNKPLLIKEK